MIETRITFKGLDQIDAMFKELPIELQRTAMRTGLRDASKVMQDGMRRRAPRAAVHRVIRKGRSYLSRLVDSITIRIRVRGDGDPIAEVGPSRRAFWARFIEYGTRFISAKPFMRPTLDHDGQIAVAAFVAGVKANLEALVRRIRRK